jgi:hypothetical protein
MPAPSISIVRKEQSALEIEVLEAELQAWLCRRQKDDEERQQYKTQLEALRTLFAGAVRDVRQDLGAISPDGALEHVYKECRQIDEVVLWLRRVWHFFRDKFDQRDSPQLRPLLKAADEVVWSCYHQVFESPAGRRLTTQHGPAPLPFIESRYAPMAFPRELVPRELTTEIGRDVVAALLSALPIPVVRLPPLCARAPWWLIYLGHEVGHHVQYSLLERAALVERFGAEVIVPAVCAADGTKPEAERWSAWSPEIFADVFSVVAMGPMALRAIVELEYQEPGRMAAQRDDYPAPVVRLALMAEVWEQLVQEAAQDPVSKAAKKLVMDRNEALRGVDLVAIAAGSAAAQRDMELVPAVAAAALGVLPGVRARLQDLCAFDLADFDSESNLAGWVTKLRNGAEIVLEDPGIRDARLVTGAALAAWAKSVASESVASESMVSESMVSESMVSESMVSESMVSESMVSEEEEEWRWRCHNVGKVAFPSILAAQYPGVRANDLPDVDVTEQGIKLARLLRSAVLGQ